MYTLSFHGYGYRSVILRILLSYLWWSFRKKHICFWEHSFYCIKYGSKMAQALDNATFIVLDIKLATKKVFNSNCSWMVNMNKTKKIEFQDSKHLLSFLIFFIMFDCTGIIASTYSHLKKSSHMLSGRQSDFQIYPSVIRYCHLQKSYIIYKVKYVCMILRSTAEVWYFNHLEDNGLHTKGNLWIIYLVRFRPTTLFTRGTFYWNGLTLFLAWIVK